MPSDDRLEAARHALELPAQAFRAALAATLEQVTAELAAHGSASDGRSRRLRAELGPFGAARIDADRLAAVLPGCEPTDPAISGVLSRARDALAELARRGDDLFHLRLEDGGSLRDAVAAALAEAGRAFGAARAVRLARTGRFVPDQHAWLFGSLEFRNWTAAERKIAPPLIVDVDGRELQAAGLAEFLDGCQKIVLLVRGDAAPAPLLRLITPGVLVLQSADASTLQRLGKFQGPAIGALVPETAAQFLHDPVSGAELWQRLRLLQPIPAAPPRAIGGVSAAQQAEELRQLEALARTPAEATGPPAPGAAADGVAAAAADPAGKLAAWLLAEADLTGVGE
ncbi:MAG: hypothetical protein HY561_10240 [Gemmatimonadetes bacterium]|nr:hypothetical protein [Gemmatimonadota bacterium]